jgi:peptidoglycan DL-endopeptidase LytE
MKGRYCAALFCAILALFFISTPGHSKSAANSIKSPTKSKNSSISSGKTPQLSADGTYTARQGDSLYRIARAFNTTIEEIMAENDLRSSKIKIGQELTIPIEQSAAAPGKEPPRSNEPAPAAPSALSISSNSPLQEGQDQEAEGTELPLRMLLADAGFKMLGVRYRFSGTSEKTGFDCSGLVKTLYSKFDIDLPRSSREQYKQGMKVDRKELEVGDLVFFSSGGKTPTHVGIYVGNDKFLHAARKARRVVVSDLNKIWYAMRYLGARRIMDLWWEEPEPAEAGN